MDNVNLRDKAYSLMLEVRLIAESIGVNVTEDDFSILDKIDNLVHEDLDDEYEIEENE